MTAVKICGLSRVEDARVAAAEGADFLGFIFAPSKRRVEPKTAREIIAQIKSEYSVRAVGVFVDENPSEMNRIARLCDLDLVQLSGGESEEIASALSVPAIQVFHIGVGGIDSSLADRIERSPAHLVLLDTASPHARGGTGEAFAWESALRVDRPFLLAGGLLPESVPRAVHQAQPWGLDVSSGVESEGRKDPDKIRAFLRAARQVADAGRFSGQPLVPGPRDDVPLRPIVELT